MNVREETEVKVFIKQVNQVKGFKSGGRKATRYDEQLNEEVQGAAPPSE